MLQTSPILRFTLLASTLLTGCRFESKKADGNDHVKFSTPFGGMEVKTNDAVTLANVGLPAYPGATPVAKEDKDNGAADVNLSFGNFQLRVKVASFRTSDKPDQVKAFYRKALSRYGDVIECANNRPVGSPARTSEGLTCDKDQQTHLSTSEVRSDGLELRAGSQKHQHIVAIEQEGAGTKFGLVALDLPGQLPWSNHGKDDAGNKDKEDDRQ